MVLDGSVVGYATIRWWQERDDTWLYLHRGHLLPGHRGQGIGSAMLSWAEERIRRLVELHGTARTGPIGTSHYRAARRTVVDSYADTGFTRKWTFQDFVATADPACWRAAWNGQDMVGVALCSVRRHDRAVGEIEELSVRTGQRRLGIGRLLLLDGLRSLRGQGATTARLFTGTANPHRSYDLYESVGFRRQNEYVRYRKPLA